MAIQVTKVGVAFGMIGRSNSVRLETVTSTGRIWFSAADADACFIGMMQDLKACESEQSRKQAKRKPYD